MDDIKDYMERVGALVKDYVPPDKERIQAAASAGNVSTKPDQATGVVALAVKDYLKAGDTLAIGLNMTANALSRYDVQSYFDDPKDDAVTLGVQFNRLPDGTSYPQQILLDASPRKSRSGSSTQATQRSLNRRRPFMVEPPEQSRSGSLADGRSRFRQSCSPDQTAPPRPLL